MVRVERFLAWLPPLLAAVFVVTLLANAHVVFQGLAANADFASAPFIAQTLSGAPTSRVVTLGNYPWYEALWLLRGTMWLPHHYAIWQAIPFVLWAATIALAGWGVAQLAPRWAAVLTMCLITCAGLNMRSIMWSLSAHGPAGLHTVIVGVWLVAALTHPTALRGWRGWALAVVVGLISAVGGTDNLVLGGALLPLGLIGGGMLLAGGRTRLALQVLSVFAIGVIGAVALTHIAEGDGIQALERVFGFAQPGALLTHVGLIIPAIDFIVANNAYGTPIGLISSIALLAGLAGSVAVGFTFWASARYLRAAVGIGQGARATSPEFLPAAEREHPEPDSALDTPATPEHAWEWAVAYWLTSLVVVLALWIFTDPATDVAGARYMIPGWIAVCALAPILAARLGWRALATATVTLITLGAVTQQIKDPRPVTGPTISDSSAIRTFAAANGVTRAYAGYWDAAPISWHTRFRLKVYPIKPSGKQPGHNVSFHMHTLNTWYRPEGGRSALILDAARDLQPTLDPAYGAPIAQSEFKSPDGSYTIYIFDHDIARELAPEEIPVPELAPAE